MYNFNVPWAVGSGALGAAHAAEISHVFGTPYLPDAASQKVADEMNAYWARFAKTGDPNGAGAPSVWPAFAPDAADNDKRLQFDAAFAVSRTGVGEPAREHARKLFGDGVGGRGDLEICLHDLRVIGDALAPVAADHDRERRPVELGGRVAERQHELRASELRKRARQHFVGALRRQVNPLGRPCTGFEELAQ
jgi:hypothetical protein